MRLLRRDPSKGYLDTWLSIPKTQVNVEGVKSSLTFVLAGDRTVNTTTLWKETDSHILVPREFYEVPSLPFEVIDCRPRQYPCVTMGSRIKLDHRFVDGALHPTGETVQQKALCALMEARGGTLQLACGKGKTIVFLELAHQLQVPTLIVVDTTQLLEQWRLEVEKHLILPEGYGLIRGLIFDWKKPVVLTTYHTLAARAATFPEEARRWFGLVGFDEGHHLNAPTFSRAVDLFYGRRIALTATPERDDGLHIISNMHVGNIIYRDLKPEMIARIFFVWTGIGVDMNDPRVAPQVNDKSGELHIKKLSGYLGTRRDRLDFVLKHLKEIVSQGRRPLVVSESVNGLVNLFALWNGATSLCTEIARPAPEEVAGQDAARRKGMETMLRAVRQKLRGDCTPKQKEKLEEQRQKLEKALRQPALTADMVPVLLEEKKLKKVEQILYRHVLPQLQDRALNPVKRQQLLKEKDKRMWELGEHRLAEEIEREYHRRWLKYLRELLERCGDSGILIDDVGAGTRLEMVRTKKVLFSIAKYGREGLDNPDIDTVLVVDPFKSKNILQQLLGRPTRRKPRKNTPVAVFLEDDVGVFMGMCNKLRGHLKRWPEDEGGPYQFELVGYPEARGRTWTERRLLLPGLGLS